MGDMLIKLHVFLTWAMDGCEWSDYVLVPLNPGKEHPVLLDRRLVGPRVSLDMVQMAMPNPAEKPDMQTIQPAMIYKMASNFLMKILKEFQCGT
jgi:hypothetical protein